MKKCLLAAVFGGLLVLAGCSPDKGQTGEAKPSPQKTEDVSVLLAALQTKPYAAEGSKTCLSCHNDAQVSPILQSAHGVQGDQRTPFGQHGCESCHGPSPEHVDAPRVAPTTVVFKGPLISPPAFQNQMCLSCHQSGLRMNWQGSEHANEDLSCTSCHTEHVRKDPVLLKLSQPAKCFTCHFEQRADSYKYSHHPIREGEVVCADCHNPHGSPGPKMLKEVTVNETCYNCHAEKRGPFLWEHLPVRENCLNCHTPHGSNQAKLLVQRPSFLCQDCHANSGHQAALQSGAQLNNPPGSPLPGKIFPPTGAITTNFRALARGCVNCHSEVHGSNNPSGAYFTR
jgi:DmsE family decaheme c-type cytochrome